MNQQDTDLVISIDEHDVIYEQESLTPSKTELWNYNQINSNKLKFDRDYLQNFYSVLELPEDLLDGTPINWHVYTGHSFSQIMEKLIAEIKDHEPKMMTIACFENAIYQVSNETIINGAKHLVQLVKDGGIHHISIATQPFIPSRQNFWHRVAKLNAELRYINIDANVPPFCLHKALMKPRDEFSGPLVVKGLMWQEFVDKEGLGTKLSYEGMGKIVHFAKLAMSYQFVDMPRKASKRWIGILKPVPLCATEGYINNHIMCNILRKKGEFNIRPVSTGALPSPRVPQPQNQPQRSLSAPTLQGAQGSSQGAQGSSRDSDPSVRRKVHLPVNTNENVFSDDESMDNDQRRPDYEIEKRPKVIEKRPNSIECEQIEQLQEEIRQTKIDTKRQKKDIEEHFEKRIKALNDELDEYEAKDDNQDKKIAKYKKENDKLKLENEAMKVERLAQDRQMQKTERELHDQKEQFTMMKGMYEFVKKLHEEKGKLLNDEWHNIIETMKNSGVHLTDQAMNVEESDVTPAKANRPKAKLQ